jgi:hypothetical protein
MRRTDFDQRWRELSEQAITGIKEWRLQHPRASLKEIEAAIDERLAHVPATNAVRKHAGEYLECRRMGATPSGEFGLSY